MNKLCVLFVIGLFSISSFAQEAIVNVVLHPAGSFKAKTTQVKGNVTKKGTGFDAANIVVDLRNLDTGIGVRDTHTKKHLEVEKYPEAILVQAHGEDGKGTGVIRIKGIEQKIAGTYELSGTNLVAHFPLKLSDFKIEGIKYMSIGVDDNVTLDVTVPIKQ
jgi:polyisoprenoid-binding protein YceI